MPREHADSPRVLICRCANADVLNDDARRGVLAGLTDAGAAFETTADLCGLAVRDPAALKDLASAGELRVVACHPRAVRWLFAVAGAPLADGAVTIFNLRSQTPEEILPDLLAGATAGDRQELQGDADNAWVPWFPVIDYDRCVGCNQCLNFCLFGVYQVAEPKTVAVANPANCKTNCPACARVCPTLAIIFPKYPAGPISGGEGELTGDGAEDIARVDLGELMQGDVMEALRDRAAAAGEPDHTSPPCAQVEISGAMQAMFGLSAAPADESPADACREKDEDPKSA